MDRRATVAVVVALAVGACRTSTAPAPLPTLEVRDGSVEAVLRALAARSNSAVVIDPTARFVATCARVQLIAPVNTDAARLADLVAASIGSVGLGMSATRDGWIVTRRAGAPLPTECMTARVTPPSLPAGPYVPYDAGPAVPAPLATAPLATTSPTVLPPLAPNVRPAPIVRPVVTIAPPEAPTPAGASVYESLAGDLHVVGPAAITVRRRALDTILERQAALMRTTRIMPRQQDGRVIGITFYGVRPQSFMSLLGFQNGDTLLRLNGFDIASPDRALEAYARLRTADTIRAEFLRAGQAMYIDYTVIP
jgi:hypothetical protein